MAVVILGIAAVAILAGLQLSVTASDIHRKQTNGGAYVRGYAEAIEKYLDTTGNYVKCAGANAYSPAAVGYTVPAGHSAAAGGRRAARRRRLRRRRHLPRRGTRASSGSG